MFFFAMFACHLITKIPPRLRHCAACSKTDGACLLVFLISRQSRPPWRGEERPWGTKHVKRPYVWARVWAQRNDMPVVLPALIRVCGRQSIMTPIILYCVCMKDLHMRAHTLSSTGCRSYCWVFGNLSGPCECAWVSVSACVFKLLFNFYFLFYSWPNPNATQLCSQPEKEGLGDGLPGPGEYSHALQLQPTDGREMGLPAWAYLLFVGQTDPTQTQLPIPLLWQ